MHDFSSYAVYINADMETIDKRLLERAERDGYSAKAMATYERRMAQNRSDIKRAEELSFLFDLTLVNNDVSECASEILKSFIDVVFSST